MDKQAETEWNRQLPSPGTCRTRHIKNSDVSSSMSCCILLLLLLLYNSLLLGYVDVVDDGPSPSRLGAVLLVLLDRSDPPKGMLVRDEAAAGVFRPFVVVDLLVLGLLLLTPNKNLDFLRRSAYLPPTAVSCSHSPGTQQYKSTKNPSSSIFCEGFQGGKNVSSSSDNGCC
jgi:hypothetical protein